MVVLTVLSFPASNNKMHVGDAGLLDVVGSFMPLVPSHICLEEL